MRQPVEQPRTVLKRCECGCGQPVAPGKRFASRQCLALHAQKFRKGRTRPSVKEEPTLEEGTTNRFLSRSRAWRSRLPLPARNRRTPMAQLSNGILPRQF